MIPSQDELFEYFSLIQLQFQLYIIYFLKGIITEVLFSKEKKFIVLEFLSVLHYYCLSKLLPIQNYVSIFNEFIIEINLIRNNTIKYLYKKICIVSKIK